MAEQNTENAPEASARLVPRLREGLDLTRVGLTIEEGFLASRIDGRSTLADLALLVGKSRTETERILRRLAAAGILVLDATESRGSSGRGAQVPSSDPAGRARLDVASVAADPASKHSGSVPAVVAESAKQARAPAATSSDKLSYEGFIFPVALMHEEVDLSDEEKKRIIFFHHHLDIWTAYELLQARRKDDAKAIKRAYFERSKEWHPDRFRRPRLGAFKKMIDAIFREVQQAYNLLSDPERRAAYDREIVFMADEDAIAEMLEKQRKEERDRRRDEEADERRIKRNPVRQRLMQSVAFHQEALELKAKGELIEALRAAQMAETYDPRPEYTALVEELKVAAGEFRIGPLMRRGLAQESLTNWDPAIEAFSEAVRLAPEHGPARLRLAFNLLMGGRDPQEVNVHAQKAAGLLPNEPEAHFVLGVCYERGGMAKAALRSFTRAVELKPNYAEAKKRIKKLKWGF